MIKHLREIAILNSHSFLSSLPGETAKSFPTKYFKVMNDDKGFRFHLIDYMVFGSMLVFSASVGVYFGYFNKSKSKRQTTTHQRHHDETFAVEEKKTTDFGSKSMLEYLLGSRKLKSFPVAMSLVASYISGVTVLGTPAEIYNFGTQYWLIIVPIFLMGFIVSYVYLPVFCALKVGSSYEV